MLHEILLLAKAGIVTLQRSGQTAKRAATLPLIPSNRVSIFPENALDFLRIAGLGQRQCRQQTGFLRAQVVGHDPVVLVVRLLGIAQHKAVRHA